MPIIRLRSNSEKPYPAEHCCYVATIINKDLRQTFVKKGFRQIKNFEHPSNEKKRRFN